MKIGIRATIDGRERGVRESLEAQCVLMAENLKTYIESNFKYSDGRNVECALYDKTIGRFPETKACEEFFEANNVCASITVTPCWCYGTETIDMHPTRPKAIWGFNGTERPGAVYLAAALSAHNQLGIPAFGIYGKDVQDHDAKNIPEDVAQKIDLFVKGALALGQMNNSSYLSVGGISMGIAGSDVNSNILREYFNLHHEFVDMVEVLRRMELKCYDSTEFEKAREWVDKYCKLGIDCNVGNEFSDDEIDEMWDKVIKMTIIIRDLMCGNPKLKELGFGEESLGHAAIAAGFQGQREWTDFQPNGDFSEAILNSSFDWNGIREPYILATENDYLNALTMLLGKLVTNTAQIFCDVRTYWSKEALENLDLEVGITSDMQNGVIHLLNSGAATIDGTGQQIKDGKNCLKPFWEIDNEDIENCIGKTCFSPANKGYFRGGGFSSTFETIGGMELTMTRITNLSGIGLVMQIIEGYSIDLPEEYSKVINERTDKTWPTTWFIPKENTDLSAYEIMNNWGANHCSLSYGHVGAELITTASMLRIPVTMHNVEQERIFRPSFWAQCSINNSVENDMFVCQKLGPLFK